MKHFSIRIDINHGAIKFAQDHFARIAVDYDGADAASCRGRNVGASHDRSLDSIPRQRAVSGSVPLRILVARPRRFLIRSGMTVPDECPLVSCVLIDAATIHAAGQQQQHTANKKTSRGHGPFFSDQSTATQ